MHCNAITRWTIARRYHGVDSGRRAEWTRGVPAAPRRAGAWRRPACPHGSVLRRCWLPGVGRQRVHRRWIARRASGGDRRDRRAHRGVPRQLRAAGVDPSAARRTGQLQLIDAGETLRKFMDGESPDEGRFKATIGTIIRRGLADHPGSSLFAYGEMVDVLWKDGNTEGAIR